MPPAHDQTRTVRLVYHVPGHEPRNNDPHYHLFTAAKKRLKAAGLYVCAFDDRYCAGQLELHHEKIEFADANEVDLDRFNKLYGLHLADEEFQVYIESEGNLEVLCEVHHRTRLGVHVIPAADWNVLRVIKDTGQPTVESITAVAVSVTTIAVEGKLETP